MAGEDTRSTTSPTRPAGASLSEAAGVGVGWPACVGVGVAVGLEDEAVLVGVGVAEGVEIPSSASSSTWLPLIATRSIQV
ncbi:MAG: hypothetical protein DYH02_12600 [Candidatus Omnitrophica bacterium COP1]|nr:hypothetical protein [Candidatus Omnitrophica bacterium COP1]